MIQVQVILIHSRIKVQLILSQQQDSGTDDPFTQQDPGTADPFTQQDPGTADPFATVGFRYR
jgi:hypothetical protein